MCTVLLMDLGRNEVGRIEKLAHKASIARTIGKTIYLLTMILRVAATSLSTEKPSGGEAQFIIDRPRSTDTTNHAFPNHSWRKRILAQRKKPHTHFA